MNIQTSFSRPLGEGEPSVSHCRKSDGTGQQLFASHPPSLSYLFILIDIIKNVVTKTLQIMINYIMLHKRYSNAKKECNLVLHSFQPYTLSELSMLNYNVK